MIYICIKRRISAVCSCFSCQVVSHLAPVRGLRTEGVHVCACERLCSLYFLYDLSGCSEAVIGLASQTGNCRPSLLLHTHTVTHTVFRKSHDLSAPPSTGKHNYRGVCLSLHPYAPSLCSHSSSSPLFSLHPVACCFRNTLKCSPRLN